MLTLAVAATTRVSAVTRAAVTCAALPEMVTALLTVTVAVVLPPRVLRAVACRVAAARSSTVIV